jgi:hypothetical protein
VYYYWAYGLTVKSEIEFPELFSITESKQVEVDLLLGEIPKIELSPRDFYSPVKTITEKEFSLHIPRVGSYYAGYGNKIVISREEGADWDSLRLFCLSNSFAAILQQRKIIPIHCAAFLFHDQLVLIFGHSGAGKSTILGAMMNKGYQVFSDDVCVPVLDQATGFVSLLSSYPMLKYWSDSLSRLGIATNQLSRKILPDMDKFGIYFHDKFLIEPRKPIFSFLLESSKESKLLKLQPINGIDLFQRLEQNTYRGEYLEYSNLKPEHFNLFARLANQSKSFLIQRSEEDDTVSDIANLIEATIKER